MYLVKRLTVSLSLLSLSLVSQSPGTDWEEQPVKDAVAKVVADALTTTKPLPPAAATTASCGFGEASQLIISQ